MPWRRKPNAHASTMRGPLWVAAFLLVGSLIPAVSGKTSTTPAPFTTDEYDSVVLPNSSSTRTPMAPATDVPPPPGPTTSRDASNSTARATANPTAAPTTTRAAAAAAPTGKGTTAKATTAPTTRATARATTDSPKASSTATKTTKGTTTATTSAKSPARTTGVPTASIVNGLADGDAKKTTSVPPTTTPTTPTTPTTTKTTKPDDDHKTPKRPTTTTTTTTTTTRSTRTATPDKHVKFYFEGNYRSTIGSTNSTQAKAFARALEESLVGAGIPRDEISQIIIQPSPVDGSFVAYVEFNNSQSAGVAEQAASERLITVVYDGIKYQASTSLPDTPSPSSTSWKPIIAGIVAAVVVIVLIVAMVSKHRQTVAVRRRAAALQYGFDSSEGYSAAAAADPRAASVPMDGMPMQLMYDGTQFSSNLSALLGDDDDDKDDTALLHMPSHNTPTPIAAAPPTSVFSSVAPSDLAALSIMSDAFLNPNAAPFGDAHDVNVSLAAVMASSAGDMPHPSVTDFDSAFSAAGSLPLWPMDPYAAMSSSHGFVDDRWDEPSPQSSYETGMSDVDPCLRGGEMDLPGAVPHHARYSQCMSPSPATDSVSPSASPTPPASAALVGTDPMARRAAEDLERMVMRCLNAGAVNEQDAYGNTALMSAVQHGNMRLIKLLLSHQANPNLANHRGITALHFACMHNPIAVVVHHLIAAEANVNAVDQERTTPLMLACRTGALPIVRKLLRADADLSLSDSRGMTALMYATIQNHADVVRALLRKKTSAAHQQDITGATALHWAAAVGAHSSAREILSVKRLNLALQNTRMETALHVAARKGDADMVASIITGRPLTRLLALLMALNEYDQTAADVALATGFVELAETLVQTRKTLTEQFAAHHPEWDPHSSTLPQDVSLDELEAWLPPALIKTEDRSSEEDMRSADESGSLPPAPASLAPSSASASTTMSAPPTPPQGFGMLQPGLGAPGAVPVSRSGYMREHRQKEKARVTKMEADVEALQQEHNQLLRQVQMLRSEAAHLRTMTSGDSTA